jgi:hypothetical protein
MERKPGTGRVRILTKLEENTTRQADDQIEDVCADCMPKIRAAAGLQPLNIKDAKSAKPAKSDEKK